MIENNDFAFFKQIPIEYLVEEDLTSLDEEEGIMIEEVKDLEEESPFHSEDFFMGFEDNKTNNKTNTN